VLVVRLITVVVMLLHSFFGCSLHDAYSCESHSAGEHACTNDARLAVDAGRGGCCSHNDGCRSDASQNEFSAMETARLVASCQGCQSSPCDGSTPGCHSEVGCSFVPASAVVIDRSLLFFEFVAYEQDSGIARVRAAAWQQGRQKDAKNIQNSLSRCAVLCTWLI